MIGMFETVMLALLLSGTAHAQMRVVKPAAKDAVQLLPRGSAGFKYTREAPADDSWREAVSCAQLRASIRLFRAH